MKSGAAIYIGPGIPARGLEKFRIYKGGVPLSFAGDDTLAPLFVPAGELRRARAALGVEGSTVWTAYRAALAAIVSKK